MQRDLCSDPCLATMICSGLSWWTVSEVTQRSVQVPVLMHGHVVNWIDSKATFGSARLHLCAHGPLPPSRAAATQGVRMPASTSHFVLDQC